MMLDKIIREHHEALFFSKEFELIKADGFDEAVIGFEPNNLRLIYSVAKVLEILEKDMSREDALEHFDFNINCAYVGPQTPIWCFDDY